MIPIYEYSCQGCGHQFEALIRGSEKPACPDCESTELEREFSLPTVHSSGTRAMSMRAAKNRDQKQGSERMHTQREYELHHDDH
ncbi:MAG: FmdB family zinc ribbon protein [Longimicrobiales bacterium]